jgi:hypothetical protein
MHLSLTLPLFVALRLRLGSPLRFFLICLSLWMICQITTPNLTAVHDRAFARRSLALWWACRVAAQDK